MTSRRTIVRLLLALAVLLAQQALAVHPFVHRAGAADTQNDQSGPAERVLCALCVAGAASGSALPSSGHPPFVSAAQVFERAPLAWCYQPPVTLAFSSRAPPSYL